jgi:hypothetical protein
MPIQYPEASRVFKGLLLAFAISVILWLMIAAFVWLEW